MNKLIQKVIGEAHDETDMSNPEEHKEVVLAKAILAHLEKGDTAAAKKEAEEILTMHGK